MSVSRHDGRELCLRESGVKYDLETERAVHGVARGPPG